MSDRTQKFPKVRTILASLCVVWFAVTSWLIFRPPPDGFVGEWNHHKFFLIVKDDLSYRKVDRLTNLEIENGTWEAIGMPAYRWWYLGERVDGTRGRFYAQSDLDRSPALLENAKVSPEPQFQVYRVGEHRSPMIVIGGGRSGSTLWTEGQSFASRADPTPWWNSVRNHLQEWFRQ